VVIAEEAAGSLTEALDRDTVEDTFDAGIQADEREGERDRLGRLVRMLRSERIDDVLVNEPGITARERVGA
jgi:hypothetical protein